MLQGQVAPVRQELLNYVLDAAPPTTLSLPIKVQERYMRYSQIVQKTPKVIYVPATQWHDRHEGLVESLA